MTTPSETDTSGLRCYDKVVDAVTYKVPRGITRDARGRVWIVRVIKNTRLVVNARFTDARFGSVRHALDAAIIHLLHSGHASLSDEVLQLSDTAVVHWRKRSGIGLCAVAYVSSPGRGRGGTFFLSTYKRVASGRGMEKFRVRLIEVLQSAYMTAQQVPNGPEVTHQQVAAQIDALLLSDDFRLFLAAGKRKADHIVVAHYIANLDGQ